MINTLGDLNLTMSLTRRFHTLIILTVFVIALPNTSTCFRNLTVGYMYGGFDNSTWFEANGAAPVMAIEQAKADGLMTGFDIRLVYRDDQCKDELAITLGMELMDLYDVDAFIGLACSVATTHLATLATYFNLPMFADASTGPALDDKIKLPTFVRVMPSFNKFGVAIRELVDTYGWRSFVVVGNDHFLCTFTVDTFTKVAKEADWQIVDWHTYERGLPDHQLEHILEHIKQTARIVILCGRTRDVDAFLVGADERDMGAPNYLYIVSPYAPISSVNPSLAGPDKSNESRVIQRAARSSIQFSVHKVYSDKSANFSVEHRRRLAGPPWFNSNPQVVSMA